MNSNRDQKVCAFTVLKLSNYSLKCSMLYQCICTSSPRHHRLREFTQLKLFHIQQRTWKIYFPWELIHTTTELSCVLFTFTLTSFSKTSWCMMTSSLIFNRMCLCMPMLYNFVLISNKINVKRYKTKEEVVLWNFH